MAGWRDLRMAGHDALHVGQLGMAASDDESIILRAGADGRIVITQDADFSVILALSGLTSPSLIHFRMRDGRPAKQSAMISANLDRMAPHLEQGSIVVIGDASLRVRRLPVL